MSIPWPFFVKLSIVAARHLRPDSLPAPLPVSERVSERPRATVPAPPTAELLAETSGARQRPHDSSAPTIPPNPIDLELLAFLPELDPSVPLLDMDLLEEAPPVEVLPELEVVGELPELEELGPADQEEVEIDSKPGDSSGVFESCFGETDLIERGASLRSVPRVVMSPVAVRSLPLDPTSGFLLGIIDGITEIEALLDMSAQPRDTVIGSLCLLFDHGVIRFS